MWKRKYAEWLKKCGREGRAELLSLAENTQAIKERFGGELQFGTAGIRGTFGYGTNCINIHSIARATQGVAQYICSLGEAAMERGVAIAYDTRAYSYTFAELSAKILAKNSIKSYLYQSPQPVPILSYTVQKLNAIVGIMITASHNPKEYNGYKVYSASGSQMSIEETTKIIHEIEKLDYFSPLENLDSTSRYILPVPKSIIEEYYRYVQSLSLKEKERTGEKKSKLVYTPLHGTGKVHVEKLLKNKGIKLYVVPTQSMQDANFSTVKVPNPEIKETLSQAIALAEKIQANTVFATDPDADRLGVAIKNDSGEFIVLTGNQVGLLLLEYILHNKSQQGELQGGGIVVKSFVSSPLAKKICQNYGVELIDVPVGFKFIGEKIEECKSSGKNFLFGFEESCGYLYGTSGSKDKDAIATAALFAEFTSNVEEQGKTIYQKLQELYSKYGYSLDKTETIAFTGLTGMDEMVETVEKIARQNIRKLDDIKVVAVYDYATGIKRYADGREEKLEFAKSNTVYFALEGGGFIAIRPSGTEPKLKIYYSVIAERAEVAEDMQKRLEKAMQKFF